MKNLLRKESLEKLSSPEQLDRLLVIIRLPGWISLMVLLFLILVIIGWSIVGRIPIKSEGLGIFFNPNAIEVMQVSDKGFVEEIHVTEGEDVKKGDTLLSVKTTDGKETILTAPGSGKILLIEVIEGQGVEFGQNLLWFQSFEEAEQKLFYGFFSITDGGAIRPGMTAHLMFDTIPPEVYGKMIGTVSKVLRFAGEPQGEILHSVPSRSLRDYLSKNEAVTVVVVEPNADSSTVSGYAWTTKEGPPFQVDIDALGKVEVFVSEKRPISYLIPIGGD